ncbi:hypothetical protein DVV14_00010 [Vibrio coralliilyticus]|nr:hypothetical protein DVV14_00010 [Vibrio coralliilyticus]
MSRNPILMEVYPPSGFLSVEPSDDMVVTINKDGSPKSIFRDDIWDYSATSSTNRLLNFRAKVENITPVDGVRVESRHQTDIANEFLKTLTLHWISALGGCSMSKLNGDVTAVSFLIRYCLDSGIPAKNIFSTPDAIDFLTSRVSTTKQIGLWLGKIQRIADTATALSNNMFWQAVKPSIEFIDRLKRTRKKFQKPRNQYRHSSFHRNLSKCAKENYRRSRLFLTTRESLKACLFFAKYSESQGVELDRG